MVFVITLVRTDSSELCASYAAGVICLFVHYSRVRKAIACTVSFRFAFKPPVMFLFVGFLRVF